MFQSLLNGIATLAAFTGLATSTTAQSQKPSPPRDGVIMLKAGDAQMAQAIQKARANLPQFLALAETSRPGLRNFSVKIGIPVDPDVEYVCVRPFRRVSDGFEGRLVNDATILPNLAHGQRIAFDEANIVDWSYLDGDRMIGNQTACALMRTLPLAEQAAFKQRYGLNC